MKRVQLILVLGVIFGININAYNQSREVDSLRTELSLVNGRKSYEVSMELFRKFLSIDYDSAVKYAELAIDQSLRLSDSLLIVTSHNARGWARYKLGNYAQGIPDFEYALRIATNNDFKTQRKYLLNNLALANNDAANYDKALDYSFQSLRVREEDGSALDISIALNNIGTIYTKLKDYENALMYFVKSKQVKEANGITYDLDRCYINIGVTLISLANYDEALKNIDHVIEICGSCPSEILLEVYYAKALALQNIERFSESENWYKKALRIARTIGAKKYEAMMLHALAKIEVQRNKYPNALSYLNASQQIVNDNSLRDQELENCLLFVAIYQQQSNFEAASEYQQRYIQINDEIFSSDLIKNISRIQTEHEERENIKTIAAKNQVLALQTEIIQRQRAQYVFIVTITILVVGLAFVLFWSNRSQRKANQALAEAKETIQEQNELLEDSNRMLESEVQDRTRELLESNEALTKVNAEMDNFIYKTSHDIRGPLASLKGICNVALLDVTDELATDYLKKLDATASKMNSILSRLLIINQINHSVLNVSDIKLKKVLDDILDMEVRKGFPSRLRIESKVDLKLILRSDIEMVKIILENLIDNAIKFHNASERVNPFVRIEIESDGDKVVTRIIDNGIGIHGSNSDKIFELFVRASEKSESGGIGLYLSKLASTKIGADIKYRTTPDGYTEFTVEFPKDLQPIVDQRKAELKRLESEKEKQKTVRNS